MAKEHINFLEKIEDKYLCYHAIMTNPLLFRNFFLPLMFGYYHKEIYLDYPNILSLNYDEKDLKRFINAFFSEWRYIPLEERIEKFFLLLDEGNWRGKHSKSNYISRLFKDVDYFDHVLLMWHREEGRKRQLAKRIIDKICDRIIKHYVTRYTRKWHYNRKLLREELQSIAYETYLEALEKNYWRKRRYINPSLSKKYITDSVEKRLQRCIIKKKADNDKRNTEMVERISCPDDDSLKAKEELQELRKYNKERACSSSVVETTDMYLDGAKPRDIAKIQGIPSNAVSKRIERFKKEVRERLPKNGL